MGYDAVDFHHFVHGGGSRHLIEGVHCSLVCVNAWHRRRTKKVTSDMQLPLIDYFHRQWFWCENLCANSNDMISTLDLPERFYCREGSWICVTKKVRWKRHYILIGVSRLMTTQIFVNSWRYSPLLYGSQKFSLVYTYNTWVIIGVIEYASTVHCTIIQPPQFFSLAKQNSRQQGVF